eukprot:SAG31_NODE_29916_length_388_cov_0.792388_1_plen_98_part_10
MYNQVNERKIEGLLHGLERMLDADSRRNNEPAYEGEMRWMPPDLNRAERDCILRKCDQINRAEKGPTRHVDMMLFAKCDPEHHAGYGCRLVITVVSSE